MNEIEKAIEYFKQSIEHIEEYLDTYGDVYGDYDLTAEEEKALETLGNEKLVNYKAAISALQAQAERRWIPVTERLPKKPPNYIDKHGHECFHTSCGVIVCDDKKRVYIANFMFCNEYFWYGYSGNVIKVTHWMPMPEPPKELEVEK